MFLISCVESLLEHLTVLSAMVTLHSVGDAIEQLTTKKLLNNKSPCGVIVKLLVTISKSKQKLQSSLQSIRGVYILGNFFVLNERRATTSVRLEIKRRIVNRNICYFGQSRTFRVQALRKNENPTTLDCCAICTTFIAWILSRMKHCLEPFREKFPENMWKNVEPRRFLTSYES